MPTSDDDVLRVLVLTPTGRDGAITCELLRRHGIESVECATPDALIAGIASGAGAAVVSDEALTERARRKLGEFVSGQPTWSDFPIVVVGERAINRDDDGKLGDLGNVNVLDRPVRLRTMVAAVRAALRARERQYAARREIRSRDEFLAMLGHELRNPLGAISLAADLLQTAETAREREHERAIIARQTRHLARLVDDLLDVARVTHGKIVLDRAAVDLGELAAAVLHTLVPVAEAAGVTLSLHAADRVVASVDRVRIEQIFTNLLTNAIKYTPHGGKARIDVARHGDLAHVEFVDTGIGIEPDLLERVFDLFAQASQGLARSRGGLGLGLTVARNLVRLHGGDISAKSEGAGRGSTFVVRFPVAGARVESAPPRPVRESLAPKRIVVVEDSDDNRELIALMLSRQGHAVATASDGPEGLESILTSKPDVALVDLGLPGFDGLELARRVRAAGERGVKLVALSGYGRREDKENAQSAGFDLHLTKPIQENRLVEALRNLATTT